MPPQPRLLKRGLLQSRHESMVQKMEESFGSSVDPFGESSEWISGSDIVFKTPNSFSPVKTRRRTTMIHEEITATSTEVIIRTQGKTIQNSADFKVPSLVMISPPGVKTRHRRSSIYTATTQKGKLSDGAATTSTDKVKKVTKSSKQAGVVKRAGRTSTSSKSSKTKITAEKVMLSASKETARSSSARDLTNSAVDGEETSSKSFEVVKEVKTPRSRKSKAVTPKKVSDSNVDTDLRKKSSKKATPKKQKSITANQGSSKKSPKKTTPRKTRSNNDQDSPNKSAKKSTRRSVKATRAEAAVVGDHETELSEISSTPRKRKSTNVNQGSIKKSPKESSLRKTRATKDQDSPIRSVKKSTRRSAKVTRAEATVIGDKNIELTDISLTVTPKKQKTTNVTEGSSKKKTSSRKTRANINQDSPVKSVKKSARKSVQRVSSEKAEATVVDDFVGSTEDSAKLTPRSRKRKASADYNESPKKSAKKTTPRQTRAKKDQNSPKKSAKKVTPNNPARKETTKDDTVQIASTKRSAKRVTRRKSKTTVDLLDSSTLSATNFTPKQIDSETDEIDLTNTSAEKATPKSSKKVTPKKSAKKVTPKKSAKKVTPKKSAEATPKKSTKKATSKQIDEETDQIVVIKKSAKKASPRQAKVMPIKTATKATPRKARSTDDHVGIVESSRKSVKKVTPKTVRASTDSGSSMKSAKKVTSDVAEIYQQEAQSSTTGVESFTVMKRKISSAAVIKETPKAPRQARTPTAAARLEKSLFVEETSGSGRKSLLQSSRFDDLGTYSGTLLDRHSLISPRYGVQRTKLAGSMLKENVSGSRTETSFVAAKEVQNRSVSESYVYGYDRNRTGEIEFNEVSELSDSKDQELQTTSSDMNVTLSHTTHSSRCTIL